MTPYFGRTCLAICFLFPAAAHGAIVATGGLDSFAPGDPNVTPWTSSQNCYVGYASSGTIAVTGGSLLQSATACLGLSSGVTGAAIVSGQGSTWKIGGRLLAGSSGTGTLSIFGGGQVSAGSVSINSKSRLILDVGLNSSLVIGSGAGTITNNGLVRMMAGTNVATGVYSPIKAGVFSGTGNWQTVGGSWNAATHQFVVSSAVTTSAGSSVSFDLAKTQRVFVTDATTGASVGASFTASSASSDSSIMTFTATVADKDTLGTSVAASGESVLGAWTFSTDASHAISSSNIAYLSLEVGSGYSLDDLTIWHCTTGAWSKYTPTDATYDGDYVNFSVSGFSGYAVSAVSVPEPKTLAMLVVALVGWFANALCKRQ